MVEGLNRFKDFFQGFEGSYILIGGTACERNLAEIDRNFRVTKDLDIILIAEGMTPAFIERFWQFVEEGKYEKREADQDAPTFYRFTNPQVAGFPFQLELFSKLPDVITLREGMRLTPVPVDGDQQSLSAILMNEDYYQFTLGNSRYIEGLHIASAPVLLCLKARAFLDLTERKAAGENIDSKNILKHRNDVFRLLAIIPPAFRQETPATIQEDLDRYITRLRAEQPLMKEVMKNAGLGAASLDSLLTIIEDVFGLAK